MLLRVLPGWFRDEFSDEMASVFRAERIEAARSGGWASGALWLRTVRDLIVLGVRVQVDSLVQDVRYTSRSLSRTRAFTAAAVATLALGLGPTLVIANRLYEVVLAPLPFANPDRLVAMWHGDNASGKSWASCPTDCPSLWDPKRPGCR